MKMHSLILACALAAGTAGLAHAELVIAGNDGHQPPEPGEQPGRTPDSVAVIDFTNGAVRTLGSVPAPASIIGPALSIALAPNERWAVVVASTKADPADPIKTAPDNTVSVIDISTPSRPRVTQTLQAGMGVYAVAINKAGNMVLTADNGADSVSIFTAANGSLTAAGKLQLPAGARPTTIGFFPDGRSAYVVTGSGLERLAVNGSSVTLAGPIASTGGNVALLTPDGRFFITNGAMRQPPPPAAAEPAAGADAGARGAAPPAGGRGRGRGPGAPAVATMIDAASGQAVATAPLGAGPEGIALSPDGTMLAAVITNGSHSARTSPAFNDFGLLKLYRVTPTSITEVAETQTGHWCQGALWSRDNRTILMACSLEREIQVYRYDGNATVTRDAAATLKFDSRPAVIASLSSR